MRLNDIVASALSGATAKLNEATAKLWRNAIGFWNRAVDEVEGWPPRMLTVLERPGRYWLD